MYLIEKPNGEKYCKIQKMWDLRSKILYIPAFTQTGKEKTTENSIIVYRSLQGNTINEGRESFYSLKIVGNQHLPEAIVRKVYVEDSEKSSVCIPRELMDSGIAFRSTQSSEFWRCYIQDIFNGSLRDVLLFLVIFWRADHTSFALYSVTILCCMAFKVPCTSFRYD